MSKKDDWVLQLLGATLSISLYLSLAWPPLKYRTAGSFGHLKNQRQVATDCTLDAWKLFSSGNFQEPVLG